MLGYYETDKQSGGLMYDVVRAMKKIALLRTEIGISNEKILTQFKGLAVLLSKKLNECKMGTLGNDRHYNDPENGVLGYNIKVPPLTGKMLELLTAAACNVTDTVIAKNTVTPKRASPTTRSPVTVPPLKAIENAFFKPLFAASAVRTFARTETFIPIYPAKAESIAPKINPIARVNPRLIQRIIKSIMAIILIVLYCLFRYAFAPSAIAEAMDFIFSLPSLSFKIILTSNRP